MGKYKVKKTVSALIFDKYSTENFWKEHIWKNNKTFKTYIDPNDNRRVFECENKPEDIPMYGIFYEEA